MSTKANIEYFKYDILLQKAAGLKGLKILYVIFARLRGLKYKLDFCVYLVLTATRSRIRLNLSCKKNNLKILSEIGENRWFKNFYGLHDDLKII